MFPEAFRSAAAGDGSGAAFWLESLVHLYHAKSTCGTASIQPVLHFIIGDCSAASFDLLYWISKQARGYFWSKA